MNEYFSKLLETVKKHEQSKIPSESGALLEETKSLDVNFKEVYKKFKELPIEESITVARELYLVSEEFRSYLEDDRNLLKKIAKHRQLEVQELND